MRITGILFLLTSFLFAGDAIQIGTSNCPTATAFNNSRKIARTFDDRRVVVYQDKQDGHEVVKLTFSDDGLHWAAPRLLAYGFSPTIAVSATDTFYVAWLTYDKDWPRMAQFHAHDIPTTPLNTPPEFDTQVTREPRSVCLDVDDQFVHQLYHFMSLDSSISRVHYALLNKDLTTTGVNGYLNKSSDGVAESPTLSCDLGFEDGPAHIAWTERHDTSSVIKYAAMYPDIFEEFEWQLAVADYRDMGFVLTLEHSDGLSSPSLSVRNFADTPLIVAAFNKDSSAITISTWNISGHSAYSLDIFDWQEYSLSNTGQALPSADDVIIPERSCAIVWQDNGNIFYGQTQSAVIKTLPAQMINSMSFAAHHPSVCYKTFRADKFDVIWMEGDAAPYKIMYRRMPKDYNRILDKMDITTTELPTAVVGQEYFAEIKVNYQDPFKGNVWSLIDGELPAGLTLAPFFEERPGNQTIVGTPLQSGESHFTLRVAYPRFPPDDYRSLADTADFTIVVKTNVAVDNRKEVVPQSYRLEPAFPNPFNPTTRIKFSVPKTSSVTISMFDINGTFIQQLKNAEYDAGNFYIEWDASTLPSGTYLIHMQADDFAAMQKCLLLK